jgi:ABC-2 type transport system permease protein
MNFLHNAWAFLVRDFQTEISYRLAFAMSFFGLFVNAGLWYFMSRFMQLGGAEHVEQLTGGLDYFSFALPGLMVGRFLDVSLHVYAGSIRTEQTTGTLEAMLVTPARLGSIVLASSSFSFMFAAIQSAVYLLIGTLVFGLELKIGSALGLIAAIIFTIIGMSGIGILSAAFVLYFKRGNPVDFLISTISLFLGGVLIPVGVLPGGLAELARFVPTYHAVEAVRDALVRGKPLDQMWGHLLALAGFAVVLVPIGLIGARIAIRRAKREGSLIQY